MMNIAKISLAVHFYESIRKAQQRIGRLDRELRSLVARMNDEETKEFIRVTGAYDRKYDQVTSHE